MEYVTLGKTGLRVSVAGLGCGGNSRLGLGRGKTEAEAIALVRQALDMGLNLLDTAAAYGTEALVGKAIKPVLRDRGLFANERYPVAERIARQGLYLPSGLALTERQIDDVCDAVAEALRA